MITLDVPLAVLAVLFRRFLDSFHYNVPASAVAATAPNSTALIVLTSALFYLYKNLNRGTLVRLSSKNRQQINNDHHSVNSSNRQKTSSWLLKSLRGTRNKYTVAIRQFADLSMENLRSCKAFTNIGRIHTKATLNQQPPKALPSPPSKRRHHHVQASHKLPPAMTLQQETQPSLCPATFTSAVSSASDETSVICIPPPPTHRHLNQRSRQKEPYYFTQQMSSRSSCRTAANHHLAVHLDGERTPNNQKVAEEPQESKMYQDTGPRTQCVPPECQKGTILGNQERTSQYQKRVDNPIACYYPDQRQVKKISFEVQTDTPEKRDASTHSDMTLELKSRQHTIDLTTEDIMVRRRETMSNIGAGDERQRRGRRKLSAAQRLEKAHSTKLIKRRLRSGKTIASIT